jgi:hypothetical protein
MSQTPEAGDNGGSWLSLPPSTFRAFREAAGKDLNHEPTQMDTNAPCRLMSSSPGSRGAEPSGIGLRPGLLLKRVRVHLCGFVVENRAVRLINQSSVSTLYDAHLSAGH